MRSVWKVLWSCWFVVGMAVQCAAAQARPGAYATGAVPAWVVPVAVASDGAIAPRGHVAYVLHDQQVRVEAQGSVLYMHAARRALDGRGVEQLAHVSINFDPSYQRLTLHALNVIRGGKVLPRLGSTRIQVLQRETELEYLIYDGSMTASAMLDDVRIGDVVEYAYSIAGSNPVFRNQAAGMMGVAWSVPVEHAFSRLVAPSSRAVGVTPHATALKPVVTDADGYRDYRWDQRNVPGLPEENDMPGWHDPYGRVQWSEFADWAAVVHWALPLYRRPADLGPALREQVARIAAEHRDPAGRAAAVLKLVQREIRYLGIEVGAGSHAPSPPALVYQRRFSDCKDKALLMVALLEALGIDAAPALVNTELTSGVAGLAPTPYAFNHVLVRVTLAGQTYWLDPTRALQAGDLAHLYQPDYGQALVLANGTTNLVPMAQPDAVRPKRVASVFDLRAGIDQPVAYTVNTTLRGAAADGMRANMASDQAEIARHYVEFYARSYPGLAAAGALEVGDEQARNTLTVVEKYTIPAIWTRNGAKKRREAQIELSDIEDVLKAPEVVNRTAPLKIAFPFELVETVEVLLPSAWNLKTYKDVVEHPAFDFSYEVSKSDDGRRLLITAYYKALRDHVTPADMASYEARLKQARNALGYRLFEPLPQPAANAPALTSLTGRFGVLIAVLVVLPLWILYYTETRRPRPEHRVVDQRLFRALVAFTLIAGGVLLPQIALQIRLPAALVGLSLLAPYVLATLRLLPASHGLYPWARRHALDDNHVRGHGWWRQIPLRRGVEVIGWCAVGTWLAGRFGGGA